MRTSFLVLVRWHGEIVATRTVEQGKKLQTFETLDGFVAPDVGVELYDVSAERAALDEVKPKRDLRSAYGLFVSGAIHLALGGVAALVMFTRANGNQLEAPDANRLGATVQADTSEVAATEGAEAHVAEPQKPSPPPPPVVPIDDDAETNEAVEAQADANVAIEGSESPGTGGLDPKTATRATCTKIKAPKNAGPICHRNVVVTSMEVPSGCFVDTVMHLGDTGTLSYPCSGDGGATLSFGKKSFKGATFDGKMEMCAGTEYPFSDGCRWTSAQRITGRLAAQSFSFAYGEAPKPGTTKQCASACSTTGTVRVK